MEVASKRVTFRLVGGGRATEWIQGMDIIVIGVIDIHDKVNLDDVI